MNIKFRNVITGEVFPATYYTIFQYLIQRYGGFFFVSVLCVIMCIALTLFYIYHLTLVSSGFTTNEKIKRSNL